MEVIKQVSLIGQKVASFSLIDGKGLHLHLCGIDEDLEIWNTNSGQVLNIQRDQMPELIAALTKIYESYLRVKGENND